MGIIGWGWMWWGGGVGRDGGYNVQHVINVEEDNEHIYVNDGFL